MDLTRDRLGAPLEVIEGAGHAVTIERAEDVNALLLGFAARHAR